MRSHQVISVVCSLLLTFIIAGCSKGAPMGGPNIDMAGGGTEAPTVVEPVAPPSNETPNPLILPDPQQEICEEMLSQPLLTGSLNLTCTNREPCSWTPALAEGVDAAVTLELEAGLTMPKGMAIEGARLTGTPNDIGIWNFIVRLSGGTCKIEKTIPFVLMLQEPEFAGGVDPALCQQAKPIAIDPIEIKRPVSASLAQAVDLSGFVHHNVGGVPQASFAGSGVPPQGWKIEEGAKVVVPANAAAGTIAVKVAITDLCNRSLEKEGTITLAIRQAAMELAKVVRIRAWVELGELSKVDDGLPESLIMKTKTPQSLWTSHTLRRQGSGLMYRFEADVDMPLTALRDFRVEVGPGIFQEGFTYVDWDGPVKAQDCTGDCEHYTDGTVDCDFTKVYEGLLIRSVRIEYQIEGSATWNLAYYNPAVLQWLGRFLYGIRTGDTVTYGQHYQRDYLTFSSNDTAVAVVVKTADADNANTNDTMMLELNPSLPSPFSSPGTVLDKEQLRERILNPEHGGASYLGPYFGQNGRLVLNYGMEYDDFKRDRLTNYADYVAGKLLWQDGSVKFRLRKEADSAGGGWIGESIRVFVYWPGRSFMLKPDGNIGLSSDRSLYTFHKTFSPRLVLESEGNLVYPSGGEFEVLEPIKAEGFRQPSGASYASEAEEAYLYFKIDGALGGIF